MRSPELTARLMNDTKWREVLELTLALRIRYEVAFTWDNRYRQGYLVPETSLKTRSVGDPGISGGGPHPYSEILGIRVFRFSRTRDPKTGIPSNDESLSLRYLERLASLGKVPVEVADEYVYVRGYATSDP